MRSRTLPAIRASAALEASYRKRLTSMIRQMQASILDTIKADYKTHGREIAMDASPAESLAEAIRALRRRWQDSFDNLAPDMARWFAQTSAARTDAQMRAALRKAGFTVRFQMTPHVRNVMEASLAENVNLIKSIPSQHFTQIEGDVLRAVQVGGNLGPLAEKLEYQYGVTKRRAATIARDQNRKAMAVVERARQMELGITQAYFKHSAGGKHPRPSHVKASRDGVIYEVAKGWWDPDAKQYVWPGTLIGCKCYSRAFLPGLAALKMAA